jgi:hypothetical protein
VDGERFVILLKWHAALGVSGPCGPARYLGPRSEVKIISEIVEKVLSINPLPWDKFGKTKNTRQLISEVIPGFDALKNIDESGNEFHIEERTLHNSEFPTPEGKPNFKVCPIPAVRENSQNRFILMTVRSESQFNTVVYDTEDRYRGISGRNVVLMNIKDMVTFGCSRKRFDNSKECNGNNDSSESSRLSN